MTSPAGAEPKPLPGNDFELVEELGRGAAGVVWRARQGGTRREVALKLLKPERASEVMLERFWREGQVTAALDHPGIVQVYGAGQWRGQPFLAYELVPGSRTLADVLDRVGLETRVRLIRDAAQALGHAHQRGLVHRDVKPQNLLVDAQGRLKVADFGLATGVELDRLTKSGALLGTPLFMAPEQFEARRDDVAPPSDVWALGVVLYLALTGRPPFDAPSFVSLGAAITKADYPSVRELAPDCPPALEQVVVQALQPDPADRPQDGNELAALLDRWLAGEPPPGARDEGARRAAWPALGGLLIAGVGVVGLALAAGRVGPQAPVDPPGASPSLAVVEPAPVPSPPSASASEVTWPAEVPGWFRELSAEERPPYPLPAGVEFARRQGSYKNVKDDSELRWIPPGRFRMGSDEEHESWTEREVPAHEVTISQGYFLGAYEVTRRQYEDFCAATGRRVPPVWAADRLGLEHPANHVSWIDARDYCAWAGLRLPSEAEWEFAARGPDSDLYPEGERLRSVPFGTGPVVVGTRDQAPAPRGLSDLVGNVWEWVADYYGDYSAGPQVDPPGPPDAEINTLEPVLGKWRVFKGGAWNMVTPVRCSTRGRAGERYSGATIGFRVAGSPR